MRSTELAQVLWWDSVRLRCSPCHSVCLYFCLSPLCLCVSFLDVAADVCVFLLYLWPYLSFHQSVWMSPSSFSLCLMPLFILLLCYKIILARHSLQYSLFIRFIMVCFQNSCDCIFPFLCDFRVAAVVSFSNDRKCVPLACLSLLDEDMLLLLMWP